MEDPEFPECVNYASVMVAKIRAIESSMALLIQEYADIPVVRTQERENVMQRIDTLIQMLKEVAKC